MSNGILTGVPGLQLLDDPASVRAALSPLRRQLLARLAQPASATELALALGLPRQKVNYHVRVLERAGLLELVEERQRRGCTERVLRASTAYIVDPGVVGAAPATVAARDRYAAEHLVVTAGRTVRDVSRMQAAAAARGSRLLTFTIEADLGFATPADVHRFTDDLASTLTELAERYAAPDGGRRYRVVVGGHPTPDGGSPP